MYASAEFGELAAWARSIVDEVDGDAARMAAAFAASCEHEVRFWDAAYAARAPRPAERDLGRVEVLEVGLRVLA